MTGHMRFIYSFLTMIGWYASGCRFNSWSGQKNF